MSYKTVPISVIQKYKILFVWFKKDPFMSYKKGPIYVIKRDAFVSFKRDALISLKNQWHIERGPSVSYKRCHIKRVPNVISKSPIYVRPIKISNLYHTKMPIYVIQTGACLCHTKMPHLCHTIWDMYVSYKNAPFMSYKRDLSVSHQNALVMSYKKWL